MPDNPLSIFAPFIAEWFQSVHPQPTETQTRAWPVIAHGDNLLVTAPTGSGKTLTAFLWTICSAPYMFYILCDIMRPGVVFVGNSPENGLRLHGTPPPVP